MFSFFQTIFQKITTAVASIAVAIGLVSAPPPPEPVVEEPIQQIVETQQKSAPQEATESDEIERLKKEVEGLRKVAVTTQQPQPQPKPSPTPQPPSPQPQPQSQPKTYELPSGVIIDENGNIIGKNLEPQVEALQKQIQNLQKQQDALQSQNQQLAQQVGVTQQFPQPVESQPTPVQPKPSLAKIDLGFAGNKNDDVVATGWNAKQIYALVYGDDGNKLQNVRINITTPDESQNATRDYADGGLNGGVKGAFWFTYYPKFVGTHTITFSVPSYGLTKSISFEATLYTLLTPKIQLDFNSPMNVTMNSNGLDDKIIASIRISPYEDSSERHLYMNKITYHLVSDDFSPTAVESDAAVPTGVQVNICSSVGSCLRPQNSHFLNESWHVDRNDFLNSGMEKIRGSFLLRARVPNKAGKFKVSIDNIEYIGFGSGNTYIPQGLPFITPEVVVQ